MHMLVSFAFFAEAPQTQEDAACSLVIHNFSHHTV